jgi:hypothetical protein
MRALSDAPQQVNKMLERKMAEPVRLGVRRERTAARSCPLTHIIQHNSLPARPIHMTEHRLKHTARAIARGEKAIAIALKFAQDLDEHRDLVTKHLQPCGSDLILISIKGHLLVEHLLEVNLCRILGIDCIPTRKGSLGFNHKLQLLRAVVEHREPKPNADLFLAIDSLNMARNQLAHNLKLSQEIEKVLNSFIDEYHLQAGTKRTPTNSLADELKSCILNLCTFLTEVRRHLAKLEHAEYAR